MIDDYCRNIDSKSHEFAKFTESGCKFTEIIVEYQMTNQSRFKIISHKLTISKGEKSTYSYQVSNRNINALSQGKHTPNLPLISYFVMLKTYYYKLNTLQFYLISPSKIRTLGF